MEKLLALKLTDVGYDFYDAEDSEQYRHVHGGCMTLRENYCVLESGYVLANGQVIDCSSPNIQNAIKQGAEPVTMYFVRDIDCIFNMEEFEEVFNLNGIYELKLDNTQGVIFTNEEDAEVYEQFIHDNPPQVIKKEQAISILQDMSMEEIARELFQEQEEWYGDGVTCYLDLRKGKIKVCADFFHPFNTDIPLIYLEACYDRTNDRGVSYMQELDMTTEEYAVIQLASCLKMEDCVKRLEDFYKEYSGRFKYKEAN